MRLTDQGTVEFGLAALMTFMLVFLRVGGMFLRAPLFGSTMFPAQARIWLSFAIALLLTPPLLGKQGGALASQSAAGYLLACATELSLGLVLGFAANALLYGLLMAGHLIDTDMGFTLASVVDPVNNENMALMSQILFLAGLVAFFALDGHYVALSALHFSFERIPPGQAAITDAMGRWLLLELAPQVLVIGVVFAAPTLAAVFLSTVALGLVARVVPEMNVFAFSFATRLLVGFAFVGLSLKYLAPVADRLVQGTFAHLTELVARGA